MHVMVGINWGSHSFLGAEDHTMVLCTGSGCNFAHECVDVEMYTYYRAVLQDMIAHQ